MSEEQLLRETKSQGSIFILARKSTQVILIVGAAVLLIRSGRTFLITVLHLKSWWAIIIAFLWLLLTISSALFVFTLLMFRFKPILIINSDGIEDHSHMGKSFWTIRVKWEEIALISPTADRRAPGFQVALTAKGQRTFLARQNRWSRFLLRTSMTKSGDFSQTIVIPQLFLPTTANSLIAQIREQFLPQILAYEIVLQQDEP